jgi:hypothetical protein
MRLVLIADCRAALKLIVAAAWNTTDTVSMRTFLSSSLSASPDFDTSPDMATTFLLDSGPCLENNYREKKCVLIIHSIIILIITNTVEPHKTATLGT